MAGNAAPVQLKLKFAEVTFLQTVAEYGLKSAIAEDSKQALALTRPFHGLLFAGPRKAEYAPLLGLLRTGVTESKAYGSCEIALTPPQKEVLYSDCQKYRQAFPVNPEQQNAIDKLKAA
ncbi:MAG: hypothetical protein J0I20_31220 [Chloroflexi bacterium]|nr:hypothetical protein [Chloroflexota bacterium]OJV94045.1 MAG: hypothetical protein BGO39_06965 [Chloroflexi bacterium 54-19]